MTGLISATINHFLFIGVWLLIPLFIEVLPICWTYLRFVSQWAIEKIRPSQQATIKFWPIISVVVPVYNSADTLVACIDSIMTGTYPVDKIKVTLVNNKSTDNSFEVFQQLQEKYPSAKMVWMEAAQGKSHALNMALYNTTGNYFIHIDSDGVLDKNALRNMVYQFEMEPDTVALTGAILTQPSLMAHRGVKRLEQLLEYHEYASAFLVSRNAEARSNTMFTMSGAFSGFRRSKIAETFMFSSDTVGEDTHMTFQMRQKGQVKLAKNAIFYVEPIEDFNALYRQRQRWQLGEMEVAHIFEPKRLLSFKHLTTNFMVRRLLIDHTLLFPRLIWLFAPMVLVVNGFSPAMLALIYIAMYLMYVFAGAIYFLLAQVYLRPFPEAFACYVKTWYVTLLLPAYKFLLSWVLLLALSNRSKSRKWQGRGIRDELSAIRETIRRDTKHIIKSEESK